MKKITDIYLRLFIPLVAILLAYKKVGVSKFFVNNVEYHFRIDLAINTLIIFLLYETFKYFFIERCKIKGKWTNAEGYTELVITKEQVETAELITLNLELEIEKVNTLKKGTKMMIEYPIDISLDFEDKRNLYKGLYSKNIAKREFFLDLQGIFGSINNTNPKRTLVFKVLCNNTEKFTSYIHVKVKSGGLIRQIIKKDLDSFQIKLR